MLFWDQALKGEFQSRLAKHGQLTVCGQLQLKCLRCEIRLQMPDACQAKPGIGKNRILAPIGIGGMLRRDDRNVFPLGWDKTMRWTDFRVKQ